MGVLRAEHAHVWFVLVTGSALQPYPDPARQARKAQQDRGRRGEVHAEPRPIAIEEVEELVAVWTTRGAQRVLVPHLNRIRDLLGDDVMRGASIDTGQSVPERIPQHW